MSNSIHVHTQSDDSYKYMVCNTLDEYFIRTHFPVEFSSKAIIIIDEQVCELHGKRYIGLLEAVFRSVSVHYVPVGEASKSVMRWESLCSSILENGISRNTPIFVIGGGVTGDLGGFVAASVLRGVPLIHIPTTVLAMVDSSIGGKTGVNHATGKNLIGAFYQPKVVCAELQVLTTLPEKEWVTGLSEVLKCAFIHDPSILDLTKKLITDVGFEHPEAWSSLISRCAQIKIDVVQKDVKEQGVREFLNFGHTFGHAIERLGDYKTFTHGEAVFAGMIAALNMSNRLGNKVNEDILNDLIHLHSFTLESLEGNEEELIQAMFRDKKAKNEQLRLVLLKEMGLPYVTSVENLDLVRQSWTHTINIFS
ncbi:MAG: 3-dehydroquinate synthase [Bacteroidota bacterium]